MIPSTKKVKNLENLKLEKTSTLIFKSLSSNPSREYKNNTTIASINPARPAFINSFRPASRAEEKGRSMIESKDKKSIATTVQAKDSKMNVFSVWEQAISSKKQQITSISKKAPKIKLF